MDRFIEELIKRNQLHINLDFDGMLCAALVSKVFPGKFKIVGYNDSKEKIWFFPEYVKELCVFLDFYKREEGAMCIDQHMLDYDKIRYEEFKFNPNRDLIPTLTSNNYYGKYPFSTFLYILYIFEKEGLISNSDIKLDTELSKGVYLRDLIFRADSTLFDYIVYNENSEKWLNRMEEDLPENSLIRQIHNEFRKIIEKDKEIKLLINKNSYDELKEQAKKKNKEIKNRVKKNYIITDSDEGFEEPSKEFFKLLRDIYKAFGAEENFTEESGEEKRLYNYKDEYIEEYKELVNDNRLYGGVFTKHNIYSCQFEEQFGKELKRKYYNLNPKKKKNEKI